MTTTSNGDRAEPLYMQIRSYLENLIASGALRPGDRLPSENTLARQFETTRATVVHAYQGLVHEGRIERVVGRGSFVARPPLDAPLVSPRIQSLEEQLEELGAEVTFRFLRFDLVDPEPNLRRVFKLDAGERLFRLERVRFVDTTPISLEIRHVPKEIGRRMTVAAFEEYAFMDILQEVLGIPITRIDGIVSARAAGPDEVKHLGVKEDAPLMFRDYTFFGGDGEVVSHGLSYYRSEVRFRYTTLNGN